MDVTRFRSNGKVGPSKNPRPNLDQPSRHLGDDQERRDLFQRHVLFPGSNRPSGGGGMDPEISQLKSKSGMRGSIGAILIKFPSAWASSEDEYIRKGIELLEKYKNHPRITITVAPHSTYIGILTIYND